MQTNMVMWIVAILLAGVGLIAFSRKEKKVMGFGKGLVGFVFLGVGVAIALMQLGYLSDLGLSPLAAGVGAGVGVGDTQDNLQADVLGCDLGTKTTVTLSAVDKYTSASAGTTHRYRINGNPALTVSNAGTLTASPGDKISILWGNETDASYYGDVSNVVVPCTGAKTFTTELVQNGSLTIEVFN
ncbi:MAG: hypothetical protein KKB31_05160, partial [Nanoarchaeota archaeon]|nr:hypothetical protein [Nanoarchaeota archaeon]